VVDLGASQSAASAINSQTDINTDVGPGPSNSASNCVSDEMTGSEQSLSQQPTTADIMQTAEDILDDLDNN